MGRKKKKRPFVVRPWSLVKCPTKEEVMAAWFHRGDSQKDFIWMLSVLSELSCYADCNLQHLGGFGNIAGRAGGLKALLAREIPELAAKYKSVSRYATLALRLRKAFNFYPPAVLAQLHWALPHPQLLNMPFIANFAEKLYRENFSDLPPTYAAFKAVVDRRMATKGAMKHPWGPALPQEKWKEAEKGWRRNVVRYHAYRDTVWHIRDTDAWSSYTEEGDEKDGEEWQY